MKTAILYKKSEMIHDPYGSDPGRASIARIIGPEVSKTIGAGIATFDQTSVNWTVLYDEIIICLKGLFRLRLGDDVIEAEPGDVIWIPEYTPVVYEGEGAEVFYTLYPVDWTETRYKQDV
ncbi:ethanolamine utilization protein EutQ [Amphritea sp. 1_MG-2023]|uniref:ethanolamine utilization protein EutQ n=1 Tax=Amphritea sp. 1_MG-2023 TaxID=3062670 RepID=UPI0026E1978F|nr:ethanolamine utilization protein EutQ [Amphritea sp. 1_MG-2023]MDO6563301.1 ethanolamine utilization protein EutQ [Amphritea sp. 1_MG-2023]